MKSRVGTIVGLVVGGLLLLTSTTGVLAYMVAVEKIPVKNEFIKRSADTIVLTVPFIPKTPKIVLSRALMAHQQVSQSSLDFSIAATSDDFSSTIGGSQLDIQIKGYTDLSDSKNPKFSLTGSITKDFSVDIRKKDQKIYFKINKVPTMLLSLLGVDFQKVEPVIKNWVIYDTTPLNTEAQKNLQDLKSSQSPTDEAMKEMTTKLLSDEILPILMMSKEEMEGFSTYKLEFKPTSEVLDKLGETLGKELPGNESSVLGTYTEKFADKKQEKLSNYLKDFATTLWVDENDYYVRKAVISFIFDPPTPDTSLYSPSPLHGLLIPTTTQSPIIVVAALKLSDFGETLPIEVPAQAISLEEYYKKFAEQFSTNDQSSLPPNPSSMPSFKIK